MAPAGRPANAPCRRRRTCPLLSVAWMRSVLLATRSRKRGEVVRTRTVVSQAHTYQWLGSFGNRGNGEYRKELAHALVVIRRSLAAHNLPQARALLRLDGLYGTGAVMADLAGLSFVMRGKDYTVLDHPAVQARLHLPPDSHFSRPESTLVRSLYDYPDVPVGPEGRGSRVVVATHPKGPMKSRVGTTRQGIVYELFFTNLPQEAVTAADIVALYLHRGAFEPVLADEDQEQDPDRWCSHAPAGQETWQIVSQWVWNLRPELGHMLEPTPLRTTEFAPPVTETTAEQGPVQGYGKPAVALPWKAGRFCSSAFFALHPTVSAISHGLNVRFCTTFAPQIRISSSTTSLRNSWVCERPLPQENPCTDSSRPRAFD